MRLKKSVISKCFTFGNAVFGSAEIEDIPVSDEAPVFQTCDFKTEITAILIAET